MKPIWSGGISFGLIYIPVSLYSASKSRQLEFHYLDKNDGSRVHYSKYRESDGKEVTAEDIVKGFEYEKGRYVVLEKEDFENANVTKSKSIEVLQFVSMDEIPIELFQKPYYLEPEEVSKKTYTLFRRALDDSEKVGIARFVMKGREHLAVLKTEGNVLILNQIRFIREMRDPDELEIPTKMKLEKEELETAKEIIGHMTKPFDASKFRDSYVKELKRAINEKKEKKTITPKGKVPEATEVKDLMKELKKSLKGVKAKS